MIYRPCIAVDGVVVVAQVDVPGRTVSSDAPPVGVRFLVEGLDDAADRAIGGMWRRLRLGLEASGENKRESDCQSQHARDRDPLPHPLFVGRRAKLI
jgi:hypothetical protein